MSACVLAMPSQRCPASCQTWSAERHRSCVEVHDGLGGFGLAERAQPDRAQRPGDFGPVDRHDLAQGVCIPHLVDGAERRVLRRPSSSCFTPPASTSGAGASVVICHHGLPWPAEA